MTILITLCIIINIIFLFKNLNRHQLFYSISSILSLLTFIIYNYYFNDLILSLFFLILFIIFELCLIIKSF